MQHGSPQGKKFNTDTEADADLDEAAQEAEEGGLVDEAPSEDDEAERAQLLMLREKLSELSQEFQVLRLRVLAMIRSDAVS